MFRTLRPGLALAIALAATAITPAGPVWAQIARQDPARCKGQREIKPLQPLEIRTSRGKAQFRVEFADTNRKREFGLMCRRALADDRGMLFDFQQPVDGVAFWMRNTLIPLDIIYIRPDGKVLSIARNVQALDETPVPAGGVIRGVLELRAGRAAELGLVPGDRIVHRIFPRG